MKPGDRVRVTRGQHEGRTGTVVPPDEIITTLRGLLLPSETRNEVERRLALPAGAQWVRLDSGAPGSPPLVPVSIEEGDLAVLGPATEPADAVMTLSAYLVITTLAVVAVFGFVLWVSSIRGRRRDVDGYACTVGLKRLRGEDNTELVTRCQNRLRARGGRQWL